VEFLAFAALAISIANPQLAPMGSPELEGLWSLLDDLADDLKEIRRRIDEE